MRMATCLDNQIKLCRTDWLAFTNVGWHGSGLNAISPNQDWIPQALQSNMGPVWQAIRIWLRTYLSVTQPHLSVRIMQTAADSLLA